MTIPQFDTQIHLGDVLVTGLLTGISYALRKFFRVATRFLDRIELHGEVIDQHSEAIRALDPAAPKFARCAQTRGADRSTALS